MWQVIKNAKTRKMVSFTWTQWSADLLLAMLQGKVLQRWPHLKIPAEGGCRMF